jgi:hypothetical protein
MPDSLSITLELQWDLLLDLELNLLEPRIKLLFIKLVVLNQ